MTNAVNRRSIRVGEVPGSNPGAPIALKNREYPRMQAKSSESAGGGGDGILGDSGMFVGIGTAEGPQQLPKRDRRWTAK
jgi:hypothetical protein